MTARLYHLYWNASTAIFGYHEIFIIVPTMAGSCEPPNFDINVQGRCIIYQSLCPRQVVAVRLASAPSWKNCPHV